MSKKLDKAAVVYKQIEREKQRHARKLKSLSKQTEAALRIKDQGQRDLALARISGQREEDCAKHTDKITDLNGNLRKIWW